MSESEERPLCPECDKPLRRNVADGYAYPWYCIACDIVYRWEDLEYAIAEPRAASSGVE